MTAPAIGNFESNNGGFNPLTCDKPADVSVGDLLLLVMANDYYTTGPQFTDNKEGWNFVKNVGSSTADCHVGMYWRIADGEEGASESYSSTNSRSWVMFYIQITGPNTDNTVDAVGADYENANAGDHDVTAVTTTSDNCLCVTGWSTDGGDCYPFVVSENDWVLGDEDFYLDSGSTGAGGWAYKTQASTGGAGVCNVDMDVSDGLAGFQIAFKEPTNGEPSINIMIVS